MAKHGDLTKAETRRLLDVIVQTLSDHLAKGHRFTIPGLGTFSTTTRGERKSYNPHYKQHMQLPPKRVVDFKPSKGVKEELKFMELDHE